MSVINLQADCVNLLIKYYKEARRAIYLSNEEDEPHNKRDESRISQSADRSLSTKATEVKSKSRGGTRCCMCFDPFSIQDVSICVFFCCHAYHETCLMDSIVSISSKKKRAAPKRDELSYYEYDNGDDEDGDDEDGDGDDDARIRCILCTTAAG